MGAALILHIDKRTDMTKQKIAFRCVCKRAYKDARSGLYNRQHLSVGKRYLHLWNITYGGHRRLNIGLPTIIKGINGVTLTAFYYHYLFNSSML